MTGPGIEDSDCGDGVGTIEDLAAGWVIDRGDAANWAPARQAELDAWLAQAVAHRVAYVRIAASWRRTDRLAALRRPMRARIVRDIPQKLIWARIAAVLGLVVVTGVFAANYFVQPKSQLIETPKGGQERLTLADGSQIELNTDSAVRIDLNNRGRTVELVRGEAYYQIKHDAAHPFVVKAGGRKIVDLGTKFTVRSTAKSLEIALLEGSIRLEGTADRPQSRAITLSPGDIAVAAAGKVSVSRMSNRRMADRLAWQRGMIVFHNTTLADVAAEFNRYGGPQLALANADIAGLTVNGRFRTTGAEDFAANAHEIFGLRVEHQGETIVLAR
jgi:transmembrane sensor